MLPRFTLVEDAPVTRVASQDVYWDWMGSVEEDLLRNYAPDLVVLTGHGVYRGHDGLRRLSELLRRELPNCTYEYRTRLVEGDVAFLEWTARADGARVDDGADSYVIRNGRIVVQTIHYTVTPFA